LALSLERRERGVAEGLNRPYPVTDLLRAVQAEIRALLHDDRRTAEKVVLHDGEMKIRSVEESEYLFWCKKWNEEFAVKDLVVRRSGSSGPWAQAEVHKMPGGEVRVNTSADLGAPPIQAQLAEDETSGLEAIAARLKGVGLPESNINLTSAGWTVGQGRPRTERCGEVERFVHGYRDRSLNRRQRQAVEQALGSEATFIWGPPGTGKTDVVACVVEGCYRQGLTVLFLAPTHVAVDQGLERICGLLAAEDEFDMGLVQRAGPIAIPSLAARYGEQIDPEQVAARLAAALDDEITRLTAELRPMRDGIAQHEEAAARTMELQELQERLQSIEQEMDAAERDARAAQARMARVRREIDHIGTPTGLLAKRKQARLQELQFELADHSREFEVCREQRATFLRLRHGCARQVEGVQAELLPLLGAVERLPALEWLREHAERLEDALKPLRQEREGIEDSVRDRCRVMGTTVSKAVQSRKLMSSVDVVVVDEAGMVNLPSAWCAAGIAGKRIVVAGDFRQLPAVTRGSGNRKASPEDRLHSRTWMDRDAFHAAGLVGADGTAVSGDPRMVVLNEQYRMRPAICGLVNEVAYPDAPLLTARREGSGLPRSRLIEDPLVLVDTSSRVLLGTGRDAHLSNQVHEAVIHELIRGLQYDTVLPARRQTDLPEGERATDRLAVISPYRNQKKALNESLAHRFGEEYEGLVDTVHRFQGSQRPLVIVDTVTGAGSKLGHFYEETGLASRTCRLLNVALSRAQDHLVVVANVEFMRRALRRGSEVGRMLRHLEGCAQRIPVEDLVPVRSAADLGALDEEELARPAFFPADEIPRAVEWDIARARSSIDIYCAFLSPYAVRRWLRRLALRVADGVRVTVHTRLHEPSTREAELVRELEGAGCRVTARERMHEKVMILDDTVLWHGSLNLLAHHGSTDLMMRITDPGSCRRVRYIVERARMDRPAHRPPKAASGTDGVGPGSAVGGRLYLNVPYEEKDEAKRLVQARWDKERRLWHVDANIPRERVRRWLPGASNEA
jgi:hypothetical protein